MNHHKVIFHKLLLIFSLIFLNSCFDPELEHGVPGQFRAMLKSDPATTIVLGWNRFQSNKDDDMVFFDTVDHGEDSSAYAYQVKPQFYSEYKKIPSAFVELRNLTPSTRYYFLVQNSFGNSKRYFFETLPAERSAKLSIIAGGDSRNNREPRKAANLLVSKLKPHFVLFGGDMTSRGTAKQWWQWLDDWQLTIGSDGRITPVVATRGNHEKSNDILHKLFWLPTSNYYAIDVAGGLARIYTLNSESSIGGDQTNWLVNDLEQKGKNARWLFAQYHKPMRPHVKRKKEGTNQYVHWSNVFFDHGMDLVFESDSHSVKTTWPVRPSTRYDSEEGFVRDNRLGTVYVGEGCWGAPLRDNDDNKSWTRDSGSFNQFKWVHVDSSKVELRTIKVDNAAQVGSVDINDRFNAPENLEVWTPSNGEVVTIK
ncbi:MAG: metallophosphoesterase family protein [Bacteriovoracaceae bacterium]|nr:metallophosphoesterase family protein [Bacteriovoracaceae bacterium]